MGHARRRNGAGLAGVCSRYVNTVNQPALYFYSLGPEPYGDGRGLAKWGEFKGRFADHDQALRGLLIAHGNPSVLTGRREGRFWSGVSIPCHEAEVIQVWSNHPDAIAQAEKLNAQAAPSDEGEISWPHVGDGTTVYLLRELHLTEVAQFQRPVVAGMLMSGDPSDADTTPLSPAGRAALWFTPRSRSALQLRLFQAQLGGVKSSVRSSEMLARLEEYECWTNSHGAVSGICANGRQLGVKPDEFEVVAWYRV